ncbi:MAG: DNA polymerase/3'-5' exonuclease PolX [Desulfobacteraceae bacterium]|nr:DNA polymerase/3'-5' exonuclease PolX [Desulfobacteraceae bacterium]
MIMHNNEIRDILAKVADLMEIKGENQFRVRAYREAARIVEGLSEQAARMVEEGQDLTQYRGIGKDMADKIREIVESGTLVQLKDLKNEVPVSLLDLMKVPSLGPRKISHIYKKLGVTTLEEMEKAAGQGEIAQLNGFGQKTQQNILDSLGRIKKKGARRLLWSDAEPFVRELRDRLSGIEGVRQVKVAGSFRRGKETVGDLDILASCGPGREQELMEAFVSFEGVKNVLARGKTKSSVILRSGLQVDLRIVAQVSYGAALHYFTGSKAHNIAVRKLGIERGYRINEYGVFYGEKRIAGKTEKEVYASVGLAFIDPELRENLGEIEAAEDGRLPKLVRRSDIRGDLHSHTRRTDGHGNLREMAEAAKALGYEYLAITEHSQKVAMAGGLNEKELRVHMENIDLINEELKGIRLLKGMEVDILADGSLDLPDSVLKDLDLTVCSVHYQQRLDRKKQTDRIIRAMDNPNLDILGHPTARLINTRDPMDIDLEKIIEAAHQRNVAIELNAQPDRLDLPHNYCKMAAEMGVKIALSTDAHSADNLDLMENGIIAARRGWLAKADIINTRPLPQLRKILRRGA